MILTPDERDRVAAQAAAQYPFESCGVILARAGERSLQACRNVQNELHARDPERYPRDARTAYYIDPADLLRIGRLEGEGFTVAVIYHSHVDAGAYFSETDRRNALLGGEPSYPDSTYVVTSVMNGRVDAMAALTLLQRDHLARINPAIVEAYLLRLDAAQVLTVRKTAAA